MKINKQKIGAMVTAGVMLALPFIVLASSGEHVGIPCGEVNPATKKFDGVNYRECGFSDLITLASNIMNFLIYKVAVPLAALGFMWVGANLVLNQDKPGAWNTAKDGFWDIGKGFAIMIAAFLLIKFVLDQFLSADQKAVTNLIIG